MSDHLPECPTEVVYDITSSPLVMTIYDDLHCICDRLRACEQRVRARYSAYLNADNEGCYAAGFRDALDAAREAVKAALPHADDCRAFCPCCMGDYDCNCERREALTAIDALLEERK